MGQAAANRKREAAAQFVVAMIVVGGGDARAARYDVGLCLHCGLRFRTGADWCRNCSQAPRPPLSFPTRADIERSLLGIWEELSVEFADDLVHDLTHHMAEHGCQVGGFAKCDTATALWDLIPPDTQDRLMENGAPE